MRRACVIALLPLLLACARADDKPDLQRIIDAWKAREKKVESFDFRWWSKHHESRDANLLEASQSGTDRVGPANSIPKLKGDSIEHYRFVADAGGRYLFEEFDHEWSPENGEFVPKHTVFIFDGKSYKALYDKGRFDYSRATIVKNPIGVVPKSDWADPIKMTFRPLSLGKFDTKRVYVASETEMIDNTRVVRLGDSGRTVWVDPVKDYMPVRLTAPDFFPVEISYQQDEVVGWVPHSWTIRRSNDLETATVTQSAINKPIADSEFELELPNNAFIQDNSNGTTTLSIIYPDGKQRTLKPGEFTGKNLRDLLNSEPDSK